MPIGYSGAPRVTPNNMDSRLRRMSRSLKTGNSGTPLRVTLFDTEKFHFEAAPISANTNARREVMKIFSSEFKNAANAVVNACVTAGFWNDCGFIDLRCAADNSLVWGINNTFGGGAGAVLYMGSTGYMQADNTAFYYDESADTLHLYRNSSNTTPSISIEEDGTGDATMRFALTGGQSYTIGTDNSDGDRFKISVGNTIGANHVVVSPTTNTVCIGGTPLSDSILHVDPSIKDPGTTMAAYTAYLPGKAIDANTTTTYFGLRLFPVPTTYDIGSGVVDGGNRTALRFEAHCNTANFEGTIARQEGIRATTGHTAGTGTISNSVGCLLRVLDTGSVTMTNVWGLYQTGATARNFFAGPLGVGFSAPGGGTIFNVGVTSSNTVAPVWIRQQGTGDSSIRFSLGTAIANFAMGIDNSDNDRLKFSTGNTVGVDNLVIDGAFNTVGIGGSPVSSAMLQVDPRLADPGTSFASYTGFLPGKEVNANSANNYFGLRLFPISTTYDIASGVVDSGGRTGLRFEAYANTAAFQGTIARQEGIRATTGHTAGTGTISNSVGLLLRVLTTGSVTMTNAWGLYQTGSIARNFFAGPLGVGFLAPGGGTIFNVGTTVNNTVPPVWIRQQGTGDSAIRFSLGTVTQNFCLGIDNSDSDKFKLNQGTSLGATVGLTVDNSNQLGLNTASPTERLDVNDDTIRLRQRRTPASAAAAGNQGDIAWDNTYFYICIATNTWQRVAHATW